MTPKEGFQARWREWGLSDEHIEAKWAEFLQIEGYKWSLEQKGVPLGEIERLSREFERNLLAKRKWGR